jgi:hypothetical protein
MAIGTEVSCAVVKALTVQQSKGRFRAQFQGSGLMRRMAGKTMNRTDC